MVANLSGLSKQIKRSGISLGLLGGDDRRKRVVAANTNAHHHTPEDDDTDNRSGSRSRGQSLGESGEDDQNELKTVHLLAANDVGQPAETELTEDSATRGSNLDGGIGIGRYHAGVLLGFLPVDHAQHGGHQVDGENVVGISEETDTSDDNGTDVVPAEGSFVDFRKGKSTPLVGVDNVGEVIVEVVERDIAAFCFHRHCESNSLVGVMNCGSKGGGVGGKEGC